MEKYKIDYSKWDLLEDSDDDDDDDDGDHKLPLHPQVTVFDTPTRVTFGGGINNNDVHVHDNELSASIPSTNKEKVEPKKSMKATMGGSEMNTLQDDAVVPSLSNVASALKTSIPTDTHGIPLSWIKNGAFISQKDMVARFQKEYSGQENEMMQMKDQLQPSSTLVVESPLQSTAPLQYYWSQDRMMIHIRIPIQFSHVKVKYHVQVSNMLSYSDRHCATFTPDSAKQQLLVTSLSSPVDSTIHNNSAVLLEGTLTHPIYVPEDFDEDEVDWSIQNYTAPVDVTSSQQVPLEKYISITLYKATPMMGMTLWWKRCLTSETKDAMIVSNKDSQQKQAFQKVWDEAHGQFQQTIQTRTKYSL